MCHYVHTDNPLYHVQQYVGIWLLQTIEGQSFIALLQNVYQIKEFKRVLC